MSVPLSPLARSIHESATMAAAAKARKMRAAGLTVHDFSMGEPDFETPEFIRAAAVEALRQGQTRYTPAAGTLELRRALVRRYETVYSLRYTPEQVAVTNGAKHAIHSAMAALCGPGDEVIIPAPYWTSYSDIAVMAGAAPVVVPTAAANGFKITPGQLRAAITPRSRVFLLNSPCNPTGSVYSRAELQALAEVLLNTDVTVMSDEIYEALTYDDAQTTCFATLHPDLVERTVVISGASKSYAMTGWRMGWALGPGHVINAMTAISSQQTGCPNSISQAAAVVAVSSDQSCVEAMRREFAARRDLVHERLAAIPGLKFAKPQGAFYAFFSIEPFLGRTVADVPLRGSESFCNVLLEKYHVNMVPGTAFGHEGYVRMSFACSRATIEAGLERLAAMLTTADCVAA